MKRSLGFLLATVAAVWVVLLFDMGGGEHDPSLSASPERRPSAEAGPVGALARAARQAREADAAPSWPTYVVGRVETLFTPAAKSHAARATGTDKKGGVGSARSSGTGAVDRDSSSRAREATGQIGQGTHSAEWRALEAAYGREARDGVWAAQQERRVAALFRERELETNLVLLHCQETVCRLVLEGDSPALFSELMYVPNLRRETGLGPQSPYSLLSGQLSIYFRGADSADEQAQRAPEAVTKTAL
jgi:hypothetical protein